MPKRPVKPVAPILSIVVPTLNEAGNIDVLLFRINAALTTAGISYEVIVIDDHSTDTTVQHVQQLESRYPVRVYLKEGRRGKAYSLLEGFTRAQGAYIAILDADLQYPPEALPEMVQQLEQGSGVVVANRLWKDESPLRSFISKSFSFVFARLLHNLRCDVQSGLKVFRKSILSAIELHPTPWTFDLEFLLEARAAGYTLSTTEIPFSNRQNGQSKIHVVQASIEIGSHAVRQKFHRRGPRVVNPIAAESKIGAGVRWQGQQYVTHSKLPSTESALQTFTVRQVLWLSFLIGIIVLGLILAPLLTVQIVVASLSSIYFIDVIFNMFLVRRSLHTPPELHYTNRQLHALDDAQLPVYTILCPLYREAHVLPGFLAAIEKIEWPHDRLDVQLLLEENDQETIDAARAMALPAYVRTVVVPHSLPKTKPKACNFGLALAQGEYLVIYDAEDIPDPLQLKKAYLGFQRVGLEVKCLQAKLNYYNPEQNVITRLFTAEYSLWFDVVLPGLQSLKTYIPLGGTSNHFRTADLRGLEGWDPFNVTEDCDLGIRLFKEGYSTAVIDSTTYEEANSQVGNWLRQRSRWLKGYMQTYLVHMRRPFDLKNEGLFHALSFQLVVGGKIAFALINPILWAATVVYFVARTAVGPAFEAVYPPAVFTMAGFSLIFGNFLYLYYYMIGCAKREQWSLLKYVVFVPFYWLATSIAAYIALYELIVKPHYWQKTRHGLQQANTKQPRLRLSLLPVVSPLSNIVQRVQGIVPADIRSSIGSTGGALVVVMMVSNGLNLLFNAFLGRVLRFEELGIMTLINTLWYLSSVFINAVAATVNERTAFFLGRGKERESRSLLAGVRVNAAVIALVLSVLWVSLIPTIGSFFNITRDTALLLFTPVFATGLLAATNRGYLQGRFAFRQVAILLLVETLAKLGLSVLLVFTGFDDVAYLAIPGSIVITALASFLLTPKITSLTIKSNSGFSGSFYTAAVASSISSVVFLSIDVLLVKHYLSPVVAGQYALLALVGKMVYFFGSLPTIFMISLVRRLDGAGKSTDHVFRTLFGISLTCVTLGWLTLGVFGSRFVPVLLGSKAAAIAPFLLPYVGALSLFTLTTVIVAYHLAKRQWLFPIGSFLLSIMMAVGIVVWHRTLGHIVDILLISSTFGFAVLYFLHYAIPHVRDIQELVHDAIDVFLPIQECGPKVDGRQRILIFNWRDTKHAYAGGAEVYVHEIAKHWATEGHQVMLFAGNDGHSLRSETVDGVHVIRRGGFYLVYLWAAIYYAFRLRQCDFDVIIDCQNGIPFFTPLYTRRPVYCLMHHVHQEVFTRSLAAPLAWFARSLEKHLMPLVYRYTPFITVSESSKREILELGLGRSGINIIHPGVDLESFVPGKKHPTPLVLYLGRLKAYKSIDTLIRAFETVVASVPSAQLVIAGTGEDSDSLQALVKQLHLSTNISFVGKVTNEEKILYMQRAWLFVNPSFMEGWGITTIEANACATPVVAADVPGLRDSVQDQSSGVLVEYGNVSEFASTITHVLENTKYRMMLSKNAVTWAKKFDWVNASQSLLQLIHQGRES